MNSDITGTMDADGDEDMILKKSHESEPEFDNDPKPSINPQEGEIIETNPENCPVKKGKVCFLGPLAGYLDVSRIRQQPEAKKVKCTKGESGSIKPILKRPTPSLLPSISSFRLKKLAEEPPQVYGQGTNISAVNDVNERRRSLGVHQSCYEITHKVNAAKKHVSLQFPIHNASSVRICVVSTTPEDLSNVPMDAILVRWKLSFTVPCYTIESVYTVLTRYGNINCLVQLSPNSALVCYREIESAKVVASAGIIGFRLCPLICSWFFKKMYKERFAAVKSHKKFYRPTSEEAFISHFRQQQKIITTCFRLHVPSMFYDHTTYIP